MNEWFINLLLIILPFFLYHLFLLEKPKAEFQLKDNDMFLAVTFVQVLLCMHFPLFTFGNGIQLDVRAVPFIVGFLYGGKRIGWILLVAVLGHRAIIGGDGFYSSVMTYTLIASFLNVIQPKFERQPSWQKYLTLLGVNLFFIFLVLFSLTAIHHFNRSWSVIIPITAFQTGCLWLIVYIIEKMKKKHMAERTIAPDGKNESDRRDGDVRFP